MDKIYFIQLFCFLSILDPNIGCVAVNMNALVQETLSFDASIYRSYEMEDNFLLPYVGEMF